METSEIYYGIYNPAKESLLKIKKESNHGAYACGQYSYYFSEDPYDPDYLVTDVSEAVRALVVHTDWYNSSEEFPSHSQMRINKDCHVVKVEKKVTITPVSVELPVNLEDKFLMVFDVADPQTLEMNLKKKKQYRGVLLKDDSTVLTVGNKFYRGSSSYNLEIVRAVHFDLTPFTWTREYTHKYPKAYIIVGEGVNI